MQTQASIHDLVTSIMELAQSIESMAGDDPNPEIMNALRYIDGQLDEVVMAIEDGKL